MKTRYISFFTVCLFLFIHVSGQDKAGNKHNPAGSWKFDAPAAPPGYNSGTIAVSLAEKKYSLTVLPDGSSYKITGEEVKVENELLTCSVYVEGEYVRVSLKAEDKNKMTGTAGYSGGSIPLTLTRIKQDK